MGRNFTPSSAWRCGRSGQHAAGALQRIDKHVHLAFEVVGRKRSTRRGRHVEKLHDRHGAMMAGTNGHAIVIDNGAKDRKSTRLNSSHVAMSYAVFCSK